MQYLLTREFIKINETSGTIQNPCRFQTLEMSTSNQKGSGILIKPLQQHTFQDATIYLRCAYRDTAEARVVPFIIDSGGSNGGLNSGGGSSIIDDSQIATDEQIDDLLDDIFG